MNERRFNPAHLARLDNPERRRMLPPEKLLESLPIQGEDSVLDLGAGTGYFSIPAAQKTQGTVYALDVEPQMLDALRANLEQHPVKNVELVQGVIEDIPLADASVNHVIASLVMHEVEPLSKGISEIKRTLRPGGYVMCLEWEKTQSESGPPLHHRIHSSDMEQAFVDSGFSVVSKQFPTDSHYLLVLKN